MSSRIPDYLDERREWVRIDDRLLMEYRVVGDPDFRPPMDEPSHESIATFINKPTADLLAQPQGPELETLLIPWLKKIDWVLEILLRQVAARAEGTVPLPSLTAVNVGGGGISFAVSRCLREGDDLEVCLILPPFTTIRARALVTRVERTQRPPGAWDVATRFVNMAADDHERLIRHILHRQAERVRSRHQSSVSV